jgi:hypothetical protein
MKRKLISYFICFIILLAGTALEAKKGPKHKRPSGSSFRVRIDQPISDSFPDMKLYVSVLEKRAPVLALIRGNFDIFIDGEPVESKIDVSGFQYTEEGVSYALLLASNGIMEGEPWETQLKSAFTFLEELRDQDELSIYSYAEEVTPLFEFKKKDESLQKLISEAEILGGNPHLFDALCYVARRFDKTSLDRKVIIVLTDGREEGSRYNKEQLLKIVGEQSIPIYSIGFKLMSGQNLYRIARISEHTGGEYVYARQFERIPKILGLLQNQIVNGYTVKFTVDSIEADDEPHQLQVRVRNRKKEASFFKNFIAKKVPLALWLLIILIILIIIVIIVIIILLLVHRKKERKKMGITKRECPVCKQYMKDDWDECLFCKYLPAKKKRRWFKKK